MIICSSFCFGFKGRSLMISSLSKQLVPQWQLVYLAALLEEAGNFQKKLFQRILKIFWKQATSQDNVKIVENIFGSGHLPKIFSKVLGGFLSFSSLSHHDVPCWKYLLVISLRKIQNEMRNFMPFTILLLLVIVLLCTTLLGTIQLDAKQIC